MQPSTEPHPLHIAVVGAAGRMGRACLAAIGEATDLVVSAAVVRPAHAVLGTTLRDAGLPGPGELVIIDDLDLALSHAQVVIDFSAPNVTAKVAQAAARAGVAVVTGVTGLSEADTAALREASATVPVLVAPNMSVGVAVLKALVREAATRLGPDWDAELLEIHHRKKQDSPSGTATALLEVLASSRASQVSEAEVYRGRGLTGPRSSGEIGVAALRGGSVVGEHTVYFLGADERLELTHRAGDRGVFAHGALRAARWAADAPPGLYGFDDVFRR